MSSARLVGRLDNTSPDRPLSVGSAWSRPHLYPGRGSGGPGLAQVLCTRTMLRRPSVYLPKRRKEGCFSPATGGIRRRIPPAWGNLANRDTGGILRRIPPAGPRAFRVPGLVVDNLRSPGLLDKPVGQPFLFTAALLAPGRGPRLTGNPPPRVRNPLLPPARDSSRTAGPTQNNPSAFAGYPG
jgi:hypothetical protein